MRDLFGRRNRNHFRHYTKIDSLWDSPQALYTEMKLDGTNDQIKAITENLFALDSDRALRFNSITRNKNNVAYQIEQFAIILKDIEDIYKKHSLDVFQIEAKSFNVGDLLESDIDTFDKFLTNRGTTTTGADLDKITSMRIELGSKQDQIINKVRRKIFLPIYVRR